MNAIEPVAVEAIYLKLHGINQKVDDFAGPRVIEQTVRETLPEGFQRSEFLLEHGASDMIIDRREMRDTLARILAKFPPILKRPTDY